MNFDDLLARLGASDGGEPGFDVEAGERRLLEGLRGLRDDPAEAQRIADLADLIEHAEEDFAAGCEAMERGDYDSAERLLRRSATRGNDEAAYWLALILALRGDQARLLRRRAEAERLAAEAARWRRYAERSGIAEALDAAADLEAPAVRPLPPPGRAGRDAAMPAGAASARAAQGQTPPGQARPAQPPRAAAAGGPAPLAPAGPAAGACYSVGVELRPFWFTAVLADDEGVCLARTRRDLPLMEPGAVASAVAEAAWDLVGDTLGPQFPRGNLALGLQLGGPLDPQTGVVHFLSKTPPQPATPDLGFRWTQAPLQDLLAQASGLDAVVLNDAVAFAERERWLGVGRVTGDYVVVLLREGVGGSVVTDGAIFKGPVEIGNFIIHTDSLRQSDAGQFGALESAAGLTAIIEAVGERTGRRPDDIEAAAAVADEDSRAVDAFTAAGVAMACGIGYLIGFAGPARLVLYAPEVMIRPGRRAADAFLKQVTKFKDLVPFEAYRNCELVLQPLGDFDGAHAAALAALRRRLAVQPSGVSASPSSGVGSDVRMSE